MTLPVQEERKKTPLSPHQLKKDVRGGPLGQNFLYPSTIATYFEGLYQQKKTNCDVAALIKAQCRDIYLCICA